MQGKKKEKRDDDKVTATIVTNDGSGSNDPITEGTTGDKDMIENRNDDEVTVMTVTSNGSGDNDPIIEGTTENKNANNAFGMDIVNNERELKICQKRPRSY